MHIKGFTPVFMSTLESRKLKNTTVVIDGQNIFFGIYKKANIPYAFGCESDRYQNYIKRYLDKFKRANLDCHFVFKGGHDNERALDIHFEAANRLHGRHYAPDEEYDDIITPIFAKDIWFQALDEMGFKYYVNCEGDHISQCVALARQLSCPVIGNNMQYLFSQIQYIPEFPTALDHNDNLVCGVVTLNNFMKQFQLTEEKIILFIMLTDTHVFHKDFFMSFFKWRNLLAGLNVDLRYLLRWLSVKSLKNAMDDIFKILPHLDHKSFEWKMANIKRFTLNRELESTKMVVYVTDENKAKISRTDPEWFEKGIFHNNIARPYVNLYRYKVVKASKFIEDYEQENSLMLSIDIVKYAFDLLTNFEGGEMTIKYIKSGNNNTVDSLRYDVSIQKPDYEASLSVFENGWGDLKQLKLFEHFITESLQTFDFARLNRAPENCRLLLIALVYFTRKKADVKHEVYSILLSYVMLVVVSEKADKNVEIEFNDKNDADKPFLDAFTDKELVSGSDCNVAWSLMRKYFDLRRDELCNIFDRAALHPLVEFQRCLEELNYLNVLCGSNFKQTYFSKTYNGTFVYNILRLLKGSEDGFELIKNKLSPAPTVVAYLSGILGIYESILYDY